MKTTNGTGPEPVIEPDRSYGLTPEQFAMGERMNAHDRERPDCEDCPTCAAFREMLWEMAS